MGITVYSLAISIVFYNLALIAVFILRRSPGFRAKHTVSLLAFITVLGVVRLVLPIDFDAAYVVRSYKIIPAIEDFLRYPVAASFTYGHLLLALWAVGSLGVVIKDVRLQRRFDRYLQSIDFVDRPGLLEIAAEYGSNFAVLISPQLHMPFTSGILHPVIYLPDVELSDAEWRMVFRHEITHIRSQDNLKKLFFLAVEALFWWNPLAHFSVGEINTLLELRCDAKVTKNLDSHGQIKYIAVLRTMMMKSITNNENSIIVTSLIGNQDEMHLRLEALTSSKSVHRFVQVMFLAAFDLLLVLSYFLILQPARYPSQNEVPLSYGGSNASYVHTDKPESADDYSFNSVDTYLYYENGSYYLYIDGERFGSVQEDSILEPPLDNLPIIGE